MSLSTLRIFTCGTPKKKNFLYYISIKKGLSSMQYMELHGENAGKKALQIDSPGASFLIVDPEENCYFTILSVVLMKHNGSFHGHHYCS